MSASLIISSTSSSVNFSPRLVITWRSSAALMYPFPSCQETGRVIRPTRVQSFQHFSITAALCSRRWAHMWDSVIKMIQNPWLFTTSYHEWQAGFIRIYLLEGSCECLIKVSNKTQSIIFVAPKSEVAIWKGCFILTTDWMCFSIPVPDFLIWMWPKVSHFFHRDFTWADCPGIPDQSFYHFRKTKLW